MVDESGNCIRNVLLDFPLIDELISKMKILIFGYTKVHQKYPQCIVDSEDARHAVSPQHDPRKIMI